MGNYKHFYSRLPKNLLLNENLYRKVNEILSLMGLIEQ